MQLKVQVSIPEEFVPLANNLSSNDDINESVKVSLAIGFYTSKVVTLARAAELADKGLLDFIDILKSKDIPWMEYTEEELMQDEAALMKLSQKEGH
jgi:predicted HTH domain antitoxin